MRLRHLAAGFVISTLFIATCTQEESDTVMPVTTDSELALEFYETGMLAFDQLKWKMAAENFMKSVEEDPNFFMPNFWMYFLSGKSSKKNVEQALLSSANLNEGEEQLRASLKYLIDGQEEKFTEQLKEAIALYPKDPHMYWILYFVQHQYFKDMEGALETVQKAVEVQPDFAFAYNYLGYTQMDLGNFDLAEKAFDTYIRLAPNTANPYDSKGDYYMATKQFEKAFESYMKAYETDSEFVVSEKKAMKAKKLIEKSME